MDLLRLSVKKDTRLTKTTLIGNALRPEVMAVWESDALCAALPTRNQTDNIRVALAYKARTWQRFESDDQECKAMVDSTKGAKGLDLRIHVRRKDVNHVSYSDEIATIKGGAGDPVTATVTATGSSQYPELVADLCNVPELQAFGEQHYFDNDLRRLAQELLAKVTMPLWPGVALVLDPKARVALDALQALIAGVVDGEVVCRLLSLDNTPANREALAHELGERMSAEAEEILEVLGFTDPNRKRCAKLYEALVTRVKSAEDLLDVEIPCWDVLAAVEMALDVEEVEA
jgi:hypothetical protein